MGLDMYLEKRIYVGANYKHNKVTGSVDLKTDGKQIGINPKRISEIIEVVGYWRKANHIHNWFVQNIQDGNDNCEDYDCSKKDLKKLLETCKKVKENNSLAPELLPTKSGFFFGATEYNKCYFKDIDDTIEIIETIMEEAGEAEYMPFEIIYSSSW